MSEISNEFNSCIKIALENAKQRIQVLENLDKKSVFDEYKEWINDGLSKHNILLIREDPSI